jgi:death-on-curing protein
VNAIATRYQSSREVIRFLDMETLLHFHDDQLRRYGGKSGIRDIGLLESALAQPKASFGGEYVHPTVFHMAAAYAFHIYRNHPFFDGNKRTALIAMYVFFHVNGYRLKAEKKALYSIMLGLAQGQIDKESLTVFLQHETKPISPK